MNNGIKKILIITDAYYPQINGVATTLSNLVHELQNRNIEVKVIEPTNKIFKIIPTPFYKEIPLVINPWRMAKEIKIFGPDAIHIATEGPLGFFAAIWCRLHKLPYSTSYHTNWPDYVRKIVKFVPEKLVYNVLKIVHKKSTNILVTNKDMKENLEKRGFNNCTIWTRGVNSNFFNPSKKVDLPYQRPIFLNVGRVSIEKNLTDFLDLDLPGTKVLVGDGPFLKEYKEKYKDVVFLGSKIGTELAKIYASADVFVFPSKTDTFGMVLIEALASGLPLAAYNVTGPSTIIKEGINGYFAAEEDKEYLKEAALKCLELDKEKILETSKYWSWKNTADIFYENLYYIEEHYWYNFYFDLL